MVVGTAGVYGVEYYTMYYLVSKGVVPKKEAFQTMWVFVSRHRSCESTCAPSLADLPVLASWHDYACRSGGNSDDDHFRLYATA